MSEQKTPSYRSQKRKGKEPLAFVEVGGARRYLGVFGTPESRQRYERFIAEWKASGGFAPTDGEDLRVLELVDRYWQHAESYYIRPDGKKTSETHLIRRALRFVVSLYGDIKAEKFGCAELKAVREQMVEHGWSRKVINKQIGRIRRAFSWAVEESLLPINTYLTLQQLKPLKKHRSKARETPRVREVSLAAVEAVLPHLSPQVAAMVRLQLLTGARPGEICDMRACDITKRGTTWTYRPPLHKTLHLDSERIIYIGPKAQAIIEQFWKPNLQAYLFSPADAEEWRSEKRREARRTPHYGKARRRQRKPNPHLSDRYDESAYYHAIVRACGDAFPPPEPLARRKGESRAEWWDRLNKEQRREFFRCRKHGKPLPAHLEWRRGETQSEWLARLTDEQQAQLKKWRKSHRWHPNQLRHTAATLYREQFGLDAAQAILGHALVETTQIYAERNAKVAVAAAEAIG